MELEAVKEKLQQRYESMEKKNGGSGQKKKREDHALYMSGGRGGRGRGGRGYYKGTCPKCGKQGHKGYQCTDGEETHHAGVVCFFCGKEGHYQTDCKSYLAAQRACVAGANEGGEHAGVAL